MGSTDATVLHRLTADKPLLPKSIMKDAFDAYVDHWVSTS